MERRRLLAVAPAGVVMLDDVPAFAGRADGAAAAGADAVYFARYQSNSQARVEIWKSDGTDIGTVKLYTAHGTSGSATTKQVGKVLVFSGKSAVDKDDVIRSTPPDIYHKTAPSTSVPCSH